MGYYFQLCHTEQDRERFAHFMLKHFTALNLPYSFPVTLSFLSNPMLLNKTAILCFNEDREVVGAFSYLRGSADQQYRNTEIAQLQAVYIARAHRGTRLFLEGLCYLAEHNAGLKKPVREFRFWVPEQLGLHRLLAKVAKREKSWDTDKGDIDEYHAQASDWDAYTGRFRRLVSYL